MKRLVVGAVLLLSLVASAGQASADPGNGRGRGQSVTWESSVTVSWESAEISLAGVTWE
jgi:hypothetical protein